VTRKFGQARRDVFLATLREAGNRTLAAERVKVSQSWVTLHRWSDPDFQRVCEEAIEATKRSLARTPDWVRGAQEERVGAGNRGVNLKAFKNQPI
jgi:hypothetical protein